MFRRECLSFADAQQAIRAILEEAAREPEQPVAVAIVDDRGDLVSYVRMDDTPLVPARLAQKKAYTASLMRRTTAAYQSFLREVNSSVADAGDPLLTAVQGGVPITLPNGVTVGGIGVSGPRTTAQRDEELARIGLTAIGL